MKVLKDRGVKAKIVDAITFISAPDADDTITITTTVLVESLRSTFVVYLLPWVGNSSREVPILLTLV